MKFKEIKTLDEMIIHLEENKNVRFIDISKVEAKEILYKQGYINVITPFKYKFAKRFKYQNPKADPYKDENGNHVYPDAVDFKDYFDLYIEERKNYPNIIKNISEFETSFKSICTYEILNYYKSRKLHLNSKIELNQFLDHIKLNASQSPLLGMNFTIDSLDYWQEKLDDMIHRKHSIFVWFDHLNLSQWEIMFAGLEEELQNIIFQELKKINKTFGATNVYDFLIKYNTVIDFRNIVAHNNSTTVLVRYRKPQRNIIRFDDERRKYNRTLGMLC